MILSGSSWPWKLTHRSIIGLKRLKQSEVFDKVSVTEICVFLTRRGTVTDFFIFWWVRKNISRKKSHHFSMLIIGYLWEEYEKFWFFIMCHDWLNVSGHSLLRAAMFWFSNVMKGRRVAHSTRDMFWKYSQNSPFVFGRCVVEMIYLPLSVVLLGETMN